MSKSPLVNIASDSKKGLYIPSPFDSVIISSIRSLASEYLSVIYSSIPFYPIIPTPYIYIM